MIENTPTTSSPASRVLGGLTLAGLALLLPYAWWWSPADRTQGDSVRIMYVHVPAAIWAFGACLITTVASALWLRKRSEGWWVLGAAAAEIALVLTAITLFTGYARQYSEASTAAVGGDLGWVRPEQLPEQLAAAVRNLAPGQVSAPIVIPGGVSIIAVQDARKILSADPRSAVFSLKQVSITFPAGITRPQAEARVAKFAEAARNVGGCGGAERIATEFNGEVVQSDQIRLRELPPALQEIMLPLQVGQATRPFGSIEEGVRTLVICGRDEADPTAPTFDQVFNQLSEERVNLRARRYLRDLRRDAVIEFR